MIAATENNTALILLMDWIFEQEVPAQYYNRSIEDILLIPVKTG
jgi:hypothetical protein